MIFAVFDVLLAVNMCINYSFFTFIINIINSLIVQYNVSNVCHHIHF